MRLLHQSSHWFSSPISHWVRKFFILLQITSPTTYTFGGTYTKEEENCNAKVTRLRITWPIKLIQLLNWNLTYLNLSFSLPWFDLPPPRPFFHLCINLDTTSQPQLFSFLVWFATATTLFSSSQQLGYNFATISTSSLRKRSPMCYWAIAY